MKADCTGHMFRRDCLLQRVIEVKIEGRKLREDEEEHVRILEIEKESP